MTRIKSGDYTLCIDRYCMWVVQKKKSQKTGEDYEDRVTGYFGNLGDVLEDLIKTAKSEDCKTIKAAIERIKKAEDAALQVAQAYKEYRVNERN